MSERPARTGPPQPPRQASQLGLAYSRHPYRYAAIPLLIGVIMLALALFYHDGMLWVVGWVVVGLGAALNLLNLVDSILVARARRRRRRAETAGRPPRG